MSEQVFKHFVAIAFAISIIATLLSQLLLSFFLRSKGVCVKRLYVGTPGYLDRKYIALCIKEKKSYRCVITLRLMLFVSIILSVLMITVINK